MACTAYPTAAITHSLIFQIKYSFAVKVCKGCGDRDHCQRCFSVIENGTCAQNIIGHSGLSKISLHEAGHLLQGDFIRLVLYHHDWPRGVPTLVLVDYTCHGDIELTRADFRDLQMMDAQGRKQKLCMLRISKDPDAGKHDWLF